MKKCLHSETTKRPYRTHSLEGDVRVAMQSPLACSLNMKKTGPRTPLCAMRGIWDAEVEIGNF